MISVVDLTSGLVSECSADAPSLDVPLPLGAGVAHAALDGIGLLHFGGAQGQPGVAESRPLPLATRTGGEEFLVRTGSPERDANGWEVFRRCVREP